MYTIQNLIFQIIYGLKQNIFSLIMKSMIFCNSNNWFIFRQSCLIIAYLSKRFRRLNNLQLWKYFPRNMLVFICLFSVCNLNLLNSIFEYKDTVSLIFNLMDVIDAIILQVSQIFQLNKSILLQGCWINQVL
jgi:hypothetical protein